MGFLDAIGGTIDKLTGSQSRGYEVEIPDHPLAQKTSWGNNKTGGGYRTGFRIGRGKDGELITKKDFKRMVVGGAFLGGGCIFAYGAMSDTGVEIDWAPLIVGGVLILIGLGIVIAFFKNFGSMTFDKTKGEWWEGDYSEKNILSDDDNGGFTKDIGAIQILNEWVRRTRKISDRNGNKREVDDSHVSYELNLVFNDGSRKTLQDTRDFGVVVDNSSKIGRYLDIPVWK